MKRGSEITKLEENLQVNTSGLDVDDDEDDDNYDKSDEVGGFRIPIVRNYSFNRAESYAGQILEAAIHFAILVTRVKFALQRRLVCR